jgi:hypothetical protein
MKKKAEFHIIKSDRTTHGGYHLGTLNINHLSSLLIDGDQVKIDMGLIHAKSVVERGIRFTSQDDEVEGGKEYWVVWVAMDRNDQGPYYAGLAVCPMRINAETRRGWKNLAEHVNRMDDALKRRVKVEGLSAESKQALRQFLEQRDPAVWENSPTELKEALAES